MYDERQPLKIGTLLRFHGGAVCYQITGAPLGEGGGSLVYPAFKGTCTPETGFQPGKIRYAIKECYPCGGSYEFRRNAAGQIEPVREDGGVYLERVQERQLHEEQITGEIYQEAFRITPILEAVDQAECSEDGGRTFTVIHNVYTVMESLASKGNSLRSYLQQHHTLTLQQTFRITEQVLLALEEVHRTHVHLDIQDGNIFIRGTLGEAGSLATLIDFSASRRIEPSTGRCAPVTDRIIFSTEGFSSPEMLQKNDGTLELGPESDLYSTGCLMLLMLTGRQPKSGELMQRTDGRYLTGFRLRKIHCPQHLLEKLQYIIAHALENEPENRYHSAEEMRQDVAEFLAALQPVQSSLHETVYDAFLCYKHGPIDSAAAKALQTNLEKLKVPKELSPAGRPFHRVFLDEGELSSTADFGAMLRDALKNSAWLIVICSPETPQSPWVQKEIQEFLEFHDRSRILAVLTGGGPEASFPEALKGTAEHPEVFAADAQGDTVGAVQKKLARDALYQVAAPMLGTNFDGLKQRRKNYVMKRALTASALALVLVLGFLGYAVERAVTISRQKDTITQQARQMGEQAEQIEQEYQATLTGRARYLANISGTLLSSGDRYGALEVALEALPDGEADHSKPLVTEALYALHNALYTYRRPAFNYFAPTGAIDSVAVSSWQLISQELSPDETSLCVLDDFGNVSIYDLESSALITRVTAWNLLPDQDDDQFLTVLYCADQELLLFSEQRIIRWNYRTDKIIWSCPYYETSLITGELQETNAYNVAVTNTFSDDEKIAVVFESLNHLTVNYLSLADGNPDQSVASVAVNFSTANMLAQISEDGKQLAIGHDTGYTKAVSDSYLYTADLESGTVKSRAVQGATIALEYDTDGYLYSLHADVPDIGEAGQEANYTLYCYDGIAGSLEWEVSGTYGSESTYDYDWISVSGRLGKVSVLLEGNSVESELCTVQIGDRIDLIDPESGELVEGCTFPSNVLDWYREDDDRLFVACADGQILQYVTTAGCYYSMSDTEFETIAAAASRSRDTFYLFPNGEDRIVVMENYIGSDSLSGMELDLQGEAVQWWDLDAYQDGTDARRIIVVETYNQDNEDYYLRMYDTDTEEQISVIQLDGTPTILGFADSESGELPPFWLFDYDSDTLYALNLLNGEVVREIDCTGPEAWGSSICDSLGDSVLVSDTNTLMLVNRQSGDISSYTFDSYIIDADFSPDGRYVAVRRQADVMSRGSYRMDLLALDTGKIYPLEGVSSPYNITPAFSPDGAYLLCPFDYYTVVSTSDGTVVNTLPISSQQNGVCCYINEDTAIVLDDNGYLKAVNTVSGEVTCEDVYHLEDVRDISSEDSWMIVRCYDGTYVYEINRDSGHFSRYFDAEDVDVDMQTGQVARYYRLDKKDHMVICPVYSLDQLISLANEVLDGRSLTEAERYKYYIED